MAIRLKGFIDSQGLTNSQFADQCGIPRPSLSQIISGRNKKISDIIVGQIHSAFPMLSVLWLLFGEGEMIVTPLSDHAEGVGEPDLFSGASDLAYIGSQQEKYANVSALTQVQNISKNAVNKDDIYEQRNAELQREIEKMRKNPRKVSHITVYYDDSTFETFYPKD